MLSTNATKAAAALKLRIAKAEEVPESFSSEVYRLTLESEAQVFLKIPYSKVKLEREAEALRVLKGNVPVPELLGYWEGDSDVTGALLLSAIEGAALSGKISAQTAEDIGIYHAKLHSIGPAGAGTGLPNVFIGWEQFLEQQFYSFAEDVKGTISDELFNRSMQAFREMKPALPPPDGPAFIHMDLRPANIIVKDGRVTGLIDFESSRFGSTEMDFTKLERDIFSKHTGTRAAFEGGYRSVRPLSDLDAILPFYRFTDAFNSIGWCKRRGIEKNQRFFGESLEILTKIFE